MNTIETCIKDTVEAQGYLYFRSVNINDLNQQVGDTDIAQGIGVYTSLPSINNKTSGQASSILLEYDIEVYYLKLNDFTDDKGEQVQAILDSLYPDVEQFYDYIRQCGVVASSQTIDDFTIDAVETLKQTKEVLTGWRIQMTIPIWRKDFYCEP